MTTAHHQLRAPRDTVNDDYVTVARWLYKSGDEVLAGRAVVELETSKSVIEVETPASGFLEIVASQGRQIEVGGLLGVVATTNATAQAAGDPSVMSADATCDSHTKAHDGNASRLISLAAQRLIEQHGIDDSDLPSGLVRESDVTALLTSKELPASAPSPSPSNPAERLRGFWGDAGRSAGDRNVSVPWLAVNYFWRNWLLGNIARVSPRGIINLVHKLRGVRMGTDCFIDPNAILETAYPENISLGSDVRIAAGAIIMTHIKPPHYLRDAGLFQNTLRDVRLEDHCFIGVNAVIMPGVTIGRASVVASGAVVTGNVPPFTMVAGNPAKVVKTYSNRGRITVEVQ